MSEEVQEKLVEFAKAHLNNNTNLKTLNVTWYGGELLLAKDIIYDLSKKFMTCVKKKE